jgi:hypothetical protein
MITSETRANQVVGERRKELCGAQFRVETLKGKRDCCQRHKSNFDTIRAVNNTRNGLANVAIGLYIQVRMSEKGVEG